MHKEKRVMEKIKSHAKHRWTEKQMNKEHICERKITDERKTLYWKQTDEWKGNYMNEE